jgi:hypothetical protein
MAVKIMMRGRPQVKRIFGFAAIVTIRVWWSDKLTQTGVVIKKLVMWCPQNSTVHSSHPNHVCWVRHRTYTGGVRSYTFYPSLANHCTREARRHVAETTFLKRIWNYWKKWKFQFLTFKSWNYKYRGIATGGKKMVRLLWVWSVSLQWLPPEALSLPSCQPPITVLWWWIHDDFIMDDDRSYQKRVFWNFCSRKWCRRSI